jgi:hypothetical protein
MARLCPVCGDRAVTQPRIGMCNVCFADMQLQQQRRAEHRADQVSALTKVKAREDVRAATAFQLREALAGRMHVTDLMLVRAATILEGREDVLLTETPPVVASPMQPAPTPIAELDAAIATFVAPLDPVDHAPVFARPLPLIVVGGGK